MSDIFDVIQAFTDDEPCDPMELERALADPDGRAHLIDMVVLRNLARRSIVGLPLARAAAPRQAVRTISWVAAAATILVGATIAGYFVGARAFSTPRPIPGSAVSPAPPAAAPAPVYVIRLEPGVDWTERAGGR
jgi:hypothetical protein